MIQPVMVVDTNTEARALARKRGLALLAASTGGALARPLIGLTVADLATWDLLGVPRRLDALEAFRRAVDGDAIRRLSEDYLDASSDPADAAWLIARVLEEANPWDELRAYVREKVEALYPAYEVDEFTDLFWGRIQQWRSEQESRS